MGYELLPVAALPNVDFPTIVVSAQLPGASPQTMADTVATPLEDQFAAIPGLAQMSSTSGLGSTSITLQFDLNRNIDGAAEDVQTAINAASGLSAEEPAVAADLPEDQSGRSADPDLRRQLRRDADLPGLDQYAYTCPGADRSRACPASAQVIIAGQQTAGHARAGQSRRAGLARHQPGGTCAPR